MCDIWISKYNEIFFKLVVREDKKYIHTQCAWCCTTYNQKQLTKISDYEVLQLCNNHNILIDQYKYRYCLNCEDHHKKLLTGFT